MASTNSFERVFDLDPAASRAGPRGFESSNFEAHGLRELSMAISNVQSSEFDGPAQFPKPMGFSKPRKPGPQEAEETQGNPREPEEPAMETLIFAKSA